MKIKSLLLAMMAIVTFASCSQNDDEALNVNDQTSALVVKFSDLVSTRAVEDPLKPSDVNYELSNVTIFLLQSDVVTNSHTLSEEEMSKPQYVFDQIEATTVNKVMVVANIPTDDVDAVKNLTSAAAIENYPYSISSQASTATNAGVKHVTLMGSSSTFVRKDHPTEAPSDPSTDHAYLEVEVTLNSLVARIEVGNVKAGDGIQNIELNAVYVNNYYNDGAKQVITLNSSSSPYWREPDFTTHEYSEASYVDAGNSAVDGSGEKCYAYQVFEGELVPHVLLCVSGKFDDGRLFTNQWVTFRKFKLSNGNYITGMFANEIYKLGDEISINEDDLTPLPEMNEVDLGVTITVAPWKATSVTPEV